VFTSGSLSKAKLKVCKKAQRAAKKKLARQARFGSFGAIMQEAQLHKERDPRWEERRRDDSDVDWGDKDGDGEGNQDEVDEISTGVGAMDLDPDLNLDVEVLQKFVAGMGMNGGRFVTMDDIADEARMRLEDEEDEERGSSEDEEDEEEEALKQEEQQMIAESGDRENVEDETSPDEYGSSDDDGASPRAGFQAKLERLRRQPQRNAEPISGDSDSGDPSRADLDEVFMTHIEVNLILPPPIWSKPYCVCRMCSRKITKSFMAALGKRGIVFSELYTMATVLKWLI
jgi:hypothetical protein